MRCAAAALAESARGLADRGRRVAHRGARGVGAVLDERDVRRPRMPSPCAIERRREVLRQLRGEVPRADAGTGHAVADDVGRVDYNLEHRPSMMPRSEVRPRSASRASSHSSARMRPDAADACARRGSGCACAGGARRRRGACALAEPRCVALTTGRTAVRQPSSRRRAAELDVFVVGEEALVEDALAEGGAAVERGRGGDAPRDRERRADRLAVADLAERAVADVDARAVDARRPGGG